VGSIYTNTIFINYIFPALYKADALEIASRWSILRLLLLSSAALRLIRTKTLAPAPFLDALTRLADFAFLTPLVGILGGV
jgi:hypothetical protein